MYLKFKSCQSVILYTCEQNNIDYIRYYCKIIAFEIFKTKTNFISANIYFISSKMIQDMKNIFNKFDKFVKSDALLYNPKFIIRIINTKQTFNKFFIRFNIAIAYFDFLDHYKIFNF